MQRLGCQLPLNSKEEEEMCVRIKTTLASHCNSYTLFPVVGSIGYSSGGVILPRLLRKPVSMTIKQVYLPAAAICM